jgi:L-fuconolactonase
MHSCCVIRWMRGIGRPSLSERDFIVEVLPACKKAAKEEMGDRVTEKIDAHVHLWRYVAGKYGWLDDSMKSLQRDFLPEDLVRALASGEIDGAVAVQARQTMEETRWLLGLADECPAIRGVVGWAPIAGEEFPGVMEEFEDRPKLKGLRHAIQDEKDENYILREDFNSGIRTLRGSGLVYEILISEQMLPQTIEFVDEHPEQVFVLDHVARPRISAGMIEPWASRMRELGRRDNIWCKVSGMVTEADWSAWDADALRPYLDVVVEAFGMDRLMAGSDWPVCLVASEYARWFGVLREYFSGLSETERDAFFGKTATEVYGLD